MRKTPLHHQPTVLEILDRVLDKGVVVDAAPGRGAPPGCAPDGIVVFEIDTHVEIITDLDDRLKNAADA